MKTQRFVSRLLLLNFAVLVVGCAQHRPSKPYRASSIEPAPRSVNDEYERAPSAGVETDRPVSGGAVNLGPLRLPKGIDAKVVTTTVSTPDVPYEISPETEALSRRLQIHVVPEQNTLADLLEEIAARAAEPPTYLKNGSTDVQRDSQPDLEPSASDDHSLTPDAPTGGLRITFNSLGMAQTGGYIPPDPSGAAGQTHVVNTVNLGYAFHDKTSGILDSADFLANFFSPLTPRGLFDPKVIYDQYENRFLIAVLDASSTPLTSRILLAVSDDGNPNGTWYMTAINSLLTISAQSHFADYPGLAVDEEAVYVTANMFGVNTGTFNDARIWIVRKRVSATTGFYHGGAVTAKLIDPPDSGGANFTLQPAHLFGVHPVPTVGTYFTAYNGTSDGTNEYLRVLTLSAPLGTTTVAAEYVNVGDIEDFSTTPAPSQPIPVPIAIEASPRRVFHSVWRSNALYSVTAIVPPVGDPNANQITTEWFKVNTTLLGSPPSCQSTPMLCVLDKGAVGGEDIGAGTATFYPSMAVAGSGSLTIGFAASGPNAFVGSYYAFRKSGDAPGTIGPSYLLRRGVDRYIRTYGAGRNRWGDYTAAALDPIDGCFWVYNEHALAQNLGQPADDNGVWGTAWGKTCPDQSICGNGVVEPGESCDSTPGCRANCTYCGNAVVDVGETCDPPGGGCRVASCTRCGDSIAQAADGEDCDDGNAVVGDGCDPNCRFEICGNAVVQAGESCDPPGVPAGQPNECRSGCSFCGDGALQSGGNLLLNGNFESGGLSNWSAAASGAGAFAASAPGTPAPISGEPTAGNPSGGAAYALADENGPGTHALSQSFVVPAGATQVILSFEMFVNDWSGLGGIVDPIGLDHTGPPNQHARVDLLNPGFGPFDTSPSAVVANYYLGVDPLPPPNPYTPYSFDITSAVVPGGTYVIRFADTGNQFYLNLGVDNVTVTTDVQLEACDDGNNYDGDGCSARCEVGCGNGTATFSQTILGAMTKTSFNWTSPVSVDYLRGDLSLVSSYNVLSTGSLGSTTSIPATETPAPGTGFYWVIRADCPASTWSSGSAKEVPGRDAHFPSF